MILALVLMGALLAGALAAFLKENPPIKVFIREFEEAAEWPWWYGASFFSISATKEVGVLIPFNIPARYLWRLYLWIRFKWARIGYEVLIWQCQTLRAEKKVLELKNKKLEEQLWDAAREGYLQGRRTG